MNAQDPALALADDELSVDPGGIVITTARVTNRSDQVEEYRFEVLGPLAGYTTVRPSKVQADVGREQSVTIQIRPPRRSDAPRGAVPLGIRVISLEHEDRAGAAETVVRVGDVHELVGRLTPVRNRARWSGLYTVELRNKGTAPVRVHLSATDPDRAFAVATAPSVMTVDPGTATGYIKLRLRRPMLLGRAAKMSFTVAAEPLDAPLASVTMPGTFERLPVVARAAAAIGTVAIAAALAAAVVLIRTPVKNGVIEARPSSTSAVAASTTAASTAGSVTSASTSAASATSSGSPSNSTSGSGTAPTSTSTNTDTPPADQPLPAAPYVEFERIAPDQDLLPAAWKDLVTALGSTKGLIVHRTDDGFTVISEHVADLPSGMALCQKVKAAKFYSCTTIP